jgi:hypothetical protein
VAGQIKQFSFWVAPQNVILHLIRMSQASLVVADVKVWVSGGSATVAGLDWGVDEDIIVPSSVFFPWLAGTLIVTRIGGSAFERERVYHIDIDSSSCSKSLFRMLLPVQMAFIGFI